MVPMPTLSWAMKTPMTEVKNSGALPPAAMKVAPATSSLIANFSVITSTTWLDSTPVSSLHYPHYPHYLHYLRYLRYPALTSLPTLREGERREGRGNGA